MDNEQLTRILNTAMVATRSQSAQRDVLKELTEKLQSPAVRALLEAIRFLANEKRCSERDAAEELISTLRELDSLWSDYVFEQGLTRLKGDVAQKRPASPPPPPRGPQPMA